MPSKYNSDFFSKLESRLDNAHKKSDDSLSVLDGKLGKIKKLIFKQDTPKGPGTSDINDKLMTIMLMKLAYSKILEEYDYYNNYDHYNKEYKELIKGYSKAYLSGARWYYGDNLPKSNYTSSQFEICKMYIMFSICSMINLKGNLKEGDIIMNTYELD
jgi:hypothetical protein